MEFIPNTGIPHFKGIVKQARASGYTFAKAINDIIDNVIFLAHSKNVLNTLLIEHMGALHNKQVIIMVVSDRCWPEKNSSGSMIKKITIAESKHINNGKCSNSSVQEI